MSVAAGQDERTHDAVQELEIKRDEAAAAPDALADGEDDDWL